MQSQILGIAPGPALAKFKKRQIIATFGGMRNSLPTLPSEAVGVGKLNSLTGKIRRPAWLRKVQASLAAQMQQEIDDELWG
ncbi:MAG: hypothetical protein MPJ50_15730 [Pirellulales bacterium]|nr:hypothetical protein [Pirellulales bacterium]